MVKVEGDAGVFLEGWDFKRTMEALCWLLVDVSTKTHGITDEEEVNRLKWFGETLAFVVGKIHRFGELEY